MQKKDPLLSFPIVAAVALDDARKIFLKPMRKAKNYRACDHFKCALVASRTHWQTVPDNSRDRRGF
jgi:hypothetical protein